jgi:hypothetical protein
MKLAGGGPALRTESKTKRAAIRAPVAPQTSDAPAIPWTSITGDGEVPLTERSHRDGQGLVVIVGPVDALILDLPKKGRAAYADAPE